MNFDWVNQINTNETHDDGSVFQSLGLDSTELDNSGGQDIINYLFDSTRFPASLDSSSMAIATSPESNSSNDMTDGNSPTSTALAISNYNSSNNNNNLSSLTTIDQSWLITLDPQLPIATASSNPTPPTAKSTTPATTSSRKMRLKQIREPIFVTEKPQNAYKKRTRKATTASTNTSLTSSNLPPISEKEQQKQPQQQNSSSSPASPSEDDDDMDINDPSDKRHLSSKEKRLLRNKISARNFRVRRKEYIKQLENLVDQQEDEINSLRKENKRLTNLNQQMVQELFQLKLQQSPNISQPQQLQQQQPNQQQQQQQQQLQHQYQNLVHCHPAQAPMMTSPPSSETNSPPNIMDALLDFNLFTNNTYLSHSLMPDFDLSCVLGDKLKTPPPSTQLEHHRELMTMYPLLAPTLASMVLRHTFTLHYAAYLSNAFPYSSSQPKNEPVDIMHLDDWVTAVSSSVSTRHNGGNGDDPDKNGKANMISSHVVQQIEYKNSSGDDDGNDDDTWTREFEKNILQQHYPYYAFMRLRGLSHNEVIRRCQASMQRRMVTERQRRRKAAAPCAKVLHGFSAVAVTLLRNPSRSPMIASVIQDTKACQISPRNNKTKMPLIASSPLRTLRIGGGKA